MSLGRSIIALFRAAVFTLPLWPAIALMTGCSDQRTVSQLAETHPASWIDPRSQDFHGTVALVNGTSSCLVCHGADLQGGDINVSCVDCHLQSGACTICHGGTDNNTGAPPVDLRGRIATTFIGVGAHTAHLEGSSDALAVPCDYCHLVPNTMLEPYHLDVGGQGPLDSIAEITWQGFADGGQAAWDHSTATCSGTYCHGNFTGGNASNSPVWTGTDQAACGTCHDTGDNPSQMSFIHPLHLGDQALICVDCHAATVDSSLAIVGAALHVNGLVEFSATFSETCDRCHGTGPEACTNCHGGTDNSTGAPPRGLRGENSELELAVGAHTTHLEGGAVADAFACTECHLVPTRLSDPGHFELDSIAEITWGPLAGDGSQWNRTTRECSNVYCHGNFSGGYRNNAVDWTSPAQAACGSCHNDGSRPQDLSGRHEMHINEEHVPCYRCHATTVNSSLAIIGKGVHVDGAKTVVFSVGQGTYTNGTCVASGCHGPEHW